MIVDQFDEMMRALGEAGPLVPAGVALHAYIVGQPHSPAPPQASALRHIAEHRNDIWLTTPGAIARHVICRPARRYRALRWLRCSR